MSSRGWRHLFAFAALRDSFHDEERHRDQKDCENSRREHSAYDGCTHNATGDSSGAGREPERHATEDKGKGGHQDGSQTKPRALECRVEKRTTFLEFDLCKFDDEDGILCGQSDQHDETDLSINIVLHLTKEQG